MKGFLKYHIKDRWVLAQQARKLKSNKATPILVFTMAKVGSLSVYQSLKKYNKAPIFHIHTLDEGEIQEGIDRCFAKGIYPDSRSPVFLLNSYLKDSDKKVKVISLFRNPIERNISAFFDAFAVHMGMSPEQYKGDLETLEVAFHQKLNHNYAIDWYGKQFFEGLGVDVYAQPFDTQKQYGILTWRNLEVLLVDSRLPDAQKTALIQDFCGLLDFKLHNVNVTAQAKHAQLYKAFKNHIRFDASYLDAQLNSRYCTHFFTEKDSKELREKWVDD